MKLELETKHCKRNTITKNKFDSNTRICGSICLYRYNKQAGLKVGL